MKKVTKAVIPAAGLGTRVLPATKAMPKGMLPLVDKPAIQYLVEEAVRSGITDILIKMCIRDSAYLAAYSRMQLQKSKVSMSFSALLFGPFYFFYRKAWKPAFGFLAAELLLAAPTFIEMLQLSGSALAPACLLYTSG